MGSSTCRVRWSHPQNFCWWGNNWGIRCDDKQPSSWLQRSFYPSLPKRCQPGVLSCWCSKCRCSKLRGKYRICRVFTAGQAFRTILYYSIHVNLAKRHLSFFPVKWISLANPQARHALSSLFNSTCIKMVDAGEGNIFVVNTGLLYMKFIRQVNWNRL